MTSEQLASGVNILKGDLAGSFDGLSGSTGSYQDLGIARRFGGAAAAYSLRDVGAMNGRVVRVRRDTGGGAGDDDEEDFSANQVASGAVEDFVGSGNDGFVSVWYDQSGNGRDVTQSSASLQPKIVSSGSLVTLNSKPAVSFDGNGVRLSATRFLTSQGNTYFAAYDVTNSLYPSDSGSIIRQGSGFRISMNVLGGSDAGKIRTQLRDGGGDQARADTSSSFDGQTILQTSIISATRGADGVKTFVNSANEASADSTDVQDVDFSTVSDGSAVNNAFYIGSINTGAFDFLGNLGEVILFNTDKTSDKTDLENDINNHYSIY